MGLLSRIFRFFRSESHSVMDKLEDPIKMTEQGIRDLKKDLQSAMKSLAEVKALSIRMKRDGTDNQKMAKDYERKAMMLLQKAQNGSIDQAEADRLATEALTKKEEIDGRAKELLTNHKHQQKMADQLQNKVQKLKSSISKYENELVTLRARARTAESMKKINKQIAQVDSTGTIAMLEKMKDKVNEEEALAEAYGDMAEIGGTLDEDIEKALGEGGASISVADSLAAMKEKLAAGKS